MRKITLLATGILAATFLTACSTTPGAQEVGECLSNGNYGAGCVVTIDYKGKPLTCVSWDGSHGETGLSCDFYAYHNGIIPSVPN